METKYRVEIWETKEIILSTNNLSLAKRIARKQGHTREIHRKLYMPIARVGRHKPCNLMGQKYYELFYTPRFLIGKDDNFKPQLSKTQQEVVTKMQSGQWYSAYDLRVSISTMEALEKKRIVNPHPQNGVYGFSPRTSLQWKLKLR